MQVDITQLADVVKIFMDADPLNLTIMSVAIVCCIYAFNEVKKK